MRNINWSIVTPCLWSGAAGVAIGALALSQLFGFMSPSSAEKFAATKTEQAVVAALAPSCAADFKALPDAKERMKVLTANKDSYAVKDAFPDELVSLPGHSYVDYDLVRACAALLTAPNKSASS